MRETNQTPDRHSPDPGSNLAQTEAALCAPSISPHRLGALGEDYVAYWLESMGWRVLDRNWSCRFGELDIVALDPERRLAIVEVKTRRSRAYGLPEEAVAASKRSHLRHAAILWLDKHDDDLLCRHRGVRFDVAALSVGPSAAGGSAQARVRLIKGAF
ncbi:hypothetical protein AB656_01325 [Bifidobacterium actinocoloniiforme DSM 22766]|nr:hypothetical protein AB656_01325 [Bifidobacterium actinocoloniiforme DSM 22766]